MNYTVDCFSLGFICESRIESENKGEVLDQALLHLDEVHATGAGSSGFREYIGGFIQQVKDEPEPEEAAAEPGSRRSDRPHSFKTWISDRLRGQRGQPTHDEEPVQ